MNNKILIITEGSTDKKIIETLIRENSLFDINDLKFQYKNGIDDACKFIDNLPTESLITKENVDRILIIVDCDDDDVNVRFQKIISRLNNKWKELKKLKLSSIPDKPGLVNKEVGKIGIGIFLFPDNNSKGCLETLCLRTFRNRDLLSCLDSYIDCIRNGKPITQNKIDKIKVKNYIHTIDPETYVCTLEKETDFCNISFTELINFLK